MTTPTYALQKYIMKNQKIRQGIILTKFFQKMANHKTPQKIPVYLILILVLEMDME